MRYRHHGVWGFTLVEVMLAAGLLAGLIAVITDLLPNILRSHVQENLSYRLNRETQQIMALLKDDIQRAGFRFVPVNLETLSIFPIETPGRNRLILRCIYETGELAQPANPGDTVLFVTGFRNLLPAEALVWSYEGQSGYQPIRSVLNNNTQVIISPGLLLAGFRPLPAGTPVLAVRRVDYQITEDGFLIRRVNNLETHRTRVDPTGTAFQYTVGTSLQNTLVPTDLPNLRFINVSLRLTRTAGVPGGRQIQITNSAVERVVPLNL